MLRKLHFSSLQPIVVYALMMALSVVVPAASVRAAEGAPIVTAVEFTPTKYLTAGEMLDAMTEIKVGEPLDEEKLMADMYAIYALGIERHGRAVFYDVNAEFVAHEDGVKVIIQPIEMPVIEVSGFDVDIDVMDAETFKKFLDFEAGELGLDELQLVVRAALDNAHQETGYVLYIPVDPYLDEQNVVHLQVRAARVGSITLAGNQKTRDYVIEREIESKPGEPFNIQTFHGDWWRIDRLGHFNQVEPNVTESWRDDTLYIDVEWQLDERQTGSAGFGAGYSSKNKLSGYLELADENLFGRGQFASIKWEFGTVMSSYDLSFYDPNIAGTRFTGGLGIYNTTTKGRKDGDKEYDDHSVGGQISFGKRFTDFLQGSMRLRIQDTVRDYGESEPKMEDRTRSIRISLFGDTTNNLMYPTEGLRYGASSELARTIWGGSTHFTKYEGNVSTYYKVGSNDQVVALRLMGGFAVDELPPQDRFHVGGADTVRGYDYGYLQGDKMLVGNAEYRFKISDAVQGVVFADTGSAWSLKDAIELDDLKSAVGIGIRFDTPLGPMRLEYGIGSEGGKASFSIGPSF